MFGLLYCISFSLKACAIGSVLIILVFIISYDLNYNTQHSQMHLQTFFFICMQTNVNVMKTFLRFFYVFDLNFLTLKKYYLIINNEHKSMVFTILILE